MENLRDPPRDFVTFRLRGGWCLLQSVGVSFSTIIFAILKIVTLLFLIASEVIYV
jgi:hypothetical protein